MAIDKAIDSTQLNTDLTSIANAIREKAGLTDSFAFPEGFVQAIAGIEAGGASFGDFDEVTSGTFVPSEDITATYAIDVGFSFQNSQDSFVFVLYSAPDFTASGTKVNLQWVNMMTTQCYTRALSGGSILSYGAYLNSSGKIARVTSGGEVGSIGTLDGGPYVVGKPLGFLITCTTSRILPANMPYYWLAGVKRA